MYAATGANGYCIQNGRKPTGKELIQIIIRGFVDDGLLQRPEMQTDEISGSSDAERCWRIEFHQNKGKSWSARIKPTGNLFKTIAFGTTLEEQWSTNQTRVYTSTSKCFWDVRSMPLLTLNLSHSNDILNNVHLEKHTIQLHMAKVHMNGRPFATEGHITLLKTIHSATVYLQISKASVEIINPNFSLQPC